MLQTKCLRKPTRLVGIAEKNQHLTNGVSFSSDFSKYLPITSTSFKKKYYFHLCAVVEEGNWLTLEENLGEFKGPKGFDAIVCMGNSFAHLPDFAGDQHDHRLAIDNFHRLLKPGGLLIIDHRNYDYIIENGSAPTKNIYYNVWES